MKSITKFMKDYKNFPVLNWSITYLQWNGKTEVEYLSKTYENKSVSDKIEEEKHKNSIIQSIIEPKNKVKKPSKNVTNKSFEHLDNVIKVGKEIEQISTRFRHDVLSKILFWIRYQFSDHEDFVEGYIPPSVYRIASNAGANKWISLSKSMNMNSWNDLIIGLEGSYPSSYQKGTFICLPCLHMEQTSNSKDLQKWSKCNDKMDLMFDFLRYFVKPEYSEIDMNKSKTNVYPLVWDWVKHLADKPQNVCDRIVSSITYGKTPIKSADFNGCTMAKIKEILPFPIVKHPKKNANWCRVRCKKLNGGYYHLPCGWYVHNECIGSESGGINDKMTDASMNGKQAGMNNLSSIDDTTVTKWNTCGVKYTIIFTNLWNALVQNETIQHEMIYKHLINFDK